jgi:uncharacterized protein involved in outer membrane biogenesis
MRRALTYTGIILSVLIGLLFLAIVVLNLIPGNYYKLLIISNVGKATGRELAISGDLDITFLTTCSFKASGITLSNAEWGSRSHMLSIDRIEGEFALFPLLRGVLDLTLLVDKSNLLLETHTSGQGNWQFAELANTDVWMLQRLLIRQLWVNETRITFLDDKSGHQLNIYNEKLIVESTEDELAIELKGKLNEIPLAFSGGLGSADFLVAKNPTRAKFTGYLGNTKLVAKGTVGPLLPTFNIDLTVAVDTESLEAFSPLAGRDLPNIGPLSLSLKLTAVDNTYELKGLHLQVGEIDITGRAAFKRLPEPGGKLRFRGKLHIDDLDLSKGLVSADTTTEPKSSPERKEAEDKIKKNKIFSSEPLPFRALRSVDANIEVTVGSLKTFQLQFEDLMGKVDLDDGLLSVKPMKARMGNGTFDGTVMLDTRNSPAVLTVDAEMTDATFSSFGGKIHSLADLKGSGDSIAAIMAELDGRFEFDVREATLDKSLMTNFGTDLIHFFNPFKEDVKSTELICAIILFDIENGIADAIKKIAAQTTDVTWLGGGKINLKTEEIVFRMVPIPRKGLGIHLGRIASLVRVGGTLTQPQIGLDPAGTAVEYGNYAAAVATSGLSLFAGRLWNKRRANTDVCDEILQLLDITDKSKEEVEGAKLK